MDPYLGEVSQGHGIHPDLKGQASLLGVLVSLMSLQKEPITSLEVTGTTFCSSQEEGRALAELLGRWYKGSILVRPYNQPRKLQVGINWEMSMQML